MTVEIHRRIADVFPIQLNMEVVAGLRDDWQCRSPEHKSIAELGQHVPNIGKHLRRNGRALVAYFRNMVIDCPLKRLPPRSAFPDPGRHDAAWLHDHWRDSPGRR